MRIIGITGGVGCGKSEVLAWLEKNFDAIAVRADDVGRDLMRPGTACTKEIIELFGPRCANEQGELDRPWIAEQVFRDPEKKEALEAIVHPAVRREIERLIFQNRACGWKWFFLESAILIEAGYENICEEIWYIYADEKVRIRRLQESRGYTEEKCRAVMSSQLPEEVYRTHCRAVIDNSGDFTRTAEQLQERMTE